MKTPFKLLTITAFFSLLTTSTAFAGGGTIIGSGADGAPLAQDLAQMDALSCPAPFVDPVVEIIRASQHVRAHLDEIDLASVYRIGGYPENATLIGNWKAISYREIPHPNYNPISSSNPIGGGALNINGLRRDNGDSFFSLRIEQNSDNSPSAQVSNFLYARPGTLETTPVSSSVEHKTRVFSFNLSTEPAQAPFPHRATLNCRTVQGANQFMICRFFNIHDFTAGVRECRQSGRRRARCWIRTIRDSEHLYAYALFAKDSN